MKCCSPLFRLSCHSRRNLDSLGLGQFAPRLRNGGLILSFDELGYGVADEIKNNFVPIPCGSCINCRINHASEWCNRVSLESGSSNRWFITLTYDDFHIPDYRKGDYLTGEYFDYTLRKSDLQKFFKRLRYRYGDGIRYFACGEYGGQTQRPHYHAIVWNLPKEFSDDFLCLKKDYFQSDNLREIWQNGNVLVGRVTDTSIAYVTQYVIKKRKGRDVSELRRRAKLDPSLDPREEEFVVMSRRPGIAKSYYLKNKDDINKFDQIFVENQGKPGGRALRPFKYFDKLSEKEFNPWELRSRRLLRGHFDGSTISSQDIRVLQAYAHSDKIDNKILKRSTL